MGDTESGKNADMHSVDFICSDILLQTQTRTFDMKHIAINYNFIDVTYKSNEII